jgi:hypothetical protein
VLESVTFSGYVDASFNVPNIVAAAEDHAAQPQTCQICLDVVDAVG